MLAWSNFQVNLVYDKAVAIGAVAIGAVFL